MTRDRRISRGKRNKRARLKREREIARQALRAVI